MLRTFLIAVLLFLWLGPAAHAQPVADPLPSPPGLVRLPPLEPLEPADLLEPDFETAADSEAPALDGTSAVAVGPPEYVPVFLFPAYAEMAMWTGSFELGLDGSEGNTQAFNVRLGLDLERAWDIHRIDVDFDYIRKTARGVTTADRSFLEWRYERLFPETPWTWFVHGTFERNDFETWDARVTADTGLGYQIIATEATRLISRAGGGFSRKVGLPDDYWAPEMVLGIDFEHKVGKRHRLKAKADYMPDVTDFASFRINSQASWELLIDDAMNLSLKFSVSNRYDSRPEGAKPNDLDYAAVVMWRF